MPFAIVHRYPNGPVYYMAPNGAYWHGDIGRQRAARFPTRARAEKILDRMPRWQREYKDVETIL